MFRIGYGEDIHILCEGKKLFLGGIKVSDDIGCIAHSDGDVLLHAICDALLGATGLGDIGVYFSDKSPLYKNKESSYFVKEVLKMIEKDYSIMNIDCLIILENIKLYSFKQLIKENVAKLLKIDKDLVNIKAGTNEKQDSVGEGKSIIAKVVVLLGKKEKNV